MKQLIIERAKLNINDDSKSLFPSDKYSIWVESDRYPHCYITSKSDVWELKVCIKTCEIREVRHKETKVISNNHDEFQDIINRLKKWFDLSTTMPNRIGTNKQAAFDEWEACSADIVAPTDPLIFRCGPSRFLKEDELFENQEGATEKQPTEAIYE